MRRSTCLRPRCRPTPPSSPSLRRRRSARNGPACCASSTGSTRRIERESAARLRLLAGGSERHGGGKRLGLAFEVQDCRLARSRGGLEGGKEVGGLLPRRAIAAEGAGIVGEIGILQAGCDHAPGIMALLVHANGAVHAVVDDDDDDRQIVL